MSYAGRFWSYEGIEVLPKPLQAPGPPAPHHVVVGDPVERYMNDVVIRGTPERVIDKLVELRETIGVDYLMCAPLGHRSFMLFTERVLPKLR